MSWKLAITLSTFNGRDVSTGGGRIGKTDQSQTVVGSETLEDSEVIQMNSVFHTLCD